MYIAAIFVPMFAVNFKKKNSRIKRRLWHILVLLMMRKIEEKNKLILAAKIIRTKSNINYLKSIYIFVLNTNVKFLE